MTVVNYTEDMDTNPLVAQGKDSNFLMLQKLNDTEQRFDGKRVSYSLEYRWLSQKCEHDKDEAYVCVQGSERTLWSKRELIEAGVLTTSGKVKNNVNLFDCFDLF